MMAYEDEEKTTRNTLEVDSNDTIYSVMAQVEDMTGVPPVLQMLTFNGKSFYHDTPGALAENELVPTYPDPILVDYTDPCKLVQHMLRRNTLRSLGFRVDDDLFPDASVMLQLVRHGDKKMMISLTDNIRMDGAGRRMVLVVEPGDTVASLKEQVQRRRRYPLAMQEIWVSDADNPYMGRRMDRLDATLADYNVKKDSRITLYMNMGFAVQGDREERGKVFNKAKEIAFPGEQQRPTADDQK
ncbi:uncharacterized protein [Miscanthus floridulus]|uniref:uncharacterized protein n=1 Tax=Miscanthus floridulus TaxID=154761 RepID=UPI00345A0495